MLTNSKGLPLDVGISIASLPTRLVFSNLDQRIYDQFTDWYAPFRIFPDNSVPFVNVTIEPGDLFLPPRSSGWYAEITHLGNRIEFVSHAEAGWYDFMREQGALVMRPIGNPENYLRVLYAWRCLNAGALLLHSSGVIRNGRGFVFFGQSGSGKTTITRLSTGAQILSDDMVILKCSDVEGRPGVEAIGVPFRGEMIEAPRTNASAQLHGLFALQKAEEHTLTEIPTSEAVGRLAAAAPFVSPTPADAARVVALCTEIVRRVPVHTLNFRRDPGFWSVIDA